MLSSLTKLVLGDVFADVRVITDVVVIGIGCYLRQLQHLEFYRTSVSSPGVLPALGRLVRLIQKLGSVR